jgi:hypothetical protein
LSRRLCINGVHNVCHVHTQHCPEYSLTWATHHAHTYPAMTIVTSRPRKRPAKRAQAAEIKVPRIVQHTPRGRAWKVQAPIEPDPEADARVAAFLARMVRPRN